MENYKFVLQFDADRCFISRNLTKTYNLEEAYKFDTQTEALNLALALGFSGYKILKFKLIYELVS